jgi:hypothetical protein
MNTEENNTQLPQSSVISSLSKSERKVLELLKKIDVIAKEPDFNSTVFGQAGYFLAFIKNPNDNQIEIERKKQCILNERVIWMSKHLIGDGGDADFV